ncbi:probable phospholipid-transporting ATPase VD isoform X2 [Exaiptasia diaphana]|uniref:Phospholipid-transporting ATPase n=1 Tax=Exaiptasia diaphana TaxID=2652724 RepID=A0A913XV03_EXADI|nr:probable phospholipid-transporting ATPase VD isoform X2 [Exaiptasia diaphana]
MAEESDQPSRYRLVVPKQHQTEEILKFPHCKNNLGNSIKTTKYTIWSFIPKNLFEQFHRFANIYFLFIVCLNWMPAINAFGREIAMLPLLFVLSVTAVKDLFEDRRRYNSDKRVNNTICHVYDSLSNEYHSTKWKDVVVGDIIRLSSDDIIPADVLLLNSSDPHDICFIETANLDGETNLKQRETVKGLYEKSHRFAPRDFDSHIKCEEPNNHIYRFHGKVECADGNVLSINNHNLLLRGCIIRNTKWVEGIVIYAGHDTKAMLNNSGPRYKHSKVERHINLDIIACVVILFTICFLCGVGCGLWTQENAFFNSHFTPGGESSPAMEGFLRFWTFIIIFQVLIPISLYVSAEIAKLGQIYFISQDLELYRKDTDQPVICRALNINEDLGQIKYVFSDKTGTLTENKMEFRKCTIGGTNFPHKDKRPNSSDQIDANSPQLSKDSQDELYNEQVPSQSNTTKNIPWDTNLAFAISTDSNSEVYQGKLSSFLREFFILLSICNTVVVSGQQPSSPSKKVTLENSEDSATNMTSHPPPVMEESTQPTASLHVDNGTGEVNQGLAPSPAKTSPQKQNGFVVPTRLNFDQCTNHNDIIYEAESPDEAALVRMASSYGFKLISRSPNTVTILIPGEGLVTFEVLHVLAFDSTRKRMSVVVRRPPDGEILMYCKGADTVVMERLSRDHRKAEDQTDSSGAGNGSKSRRHSITESTEIHLDVYARDGLRTLCMARKELTEDQYREWLTEHRKAETALDHRERKLYESAQRLETNMELLGATGIEDRLQDGVPQTIAQLRQAGIKVWVLTGDKQETAVSVSYACKLLDRNMEKIFLNAKSREDCSVQITAHLRRLHLGSSDSIHIGPSTSTDESTCSNGELPKGLVIDGRTLVYALEKPLNLKFLTLASHCQVVLCCRATPIQKASVVQLVRDGLKVMTLAIGDGANDVSMIQMADVGIGITGQEGMQAVMASDFAIGRFRFLTQLLLVHGHWCYDRITKMFLYFFYKNAMFVFVLFWFQLYNGFSGSNLIDDLSLIFFNLIFTAVPPVICGILDKDLPASVLKNNPPLYKTGQNDKLYTRKSFWLTILDALYQSVVLFFFCSIVFEGSIADDRLVGITIHQAAVIVASLHMGLVFAQWTWIHHVMLWGSVALSFAWTICYGLVLVTHKIYYVSIATLGSKEFWSLCSLIAITALLPRYSLLSLRRTLWPTEIDKAQIKITTRQSTFSPNLVRIDANTEPPTQVSGLGT